MAILKRTKKEAPAVSEAATKKDAAKSKAKTKKAVAGSSRAYRVLLRPCVTEKAARMATDGVYTFEVPTSVGKVEVRQAVQAVYGVVPRRVNVVKMPGKRVRFGRGLGQRQDRQKAYVFLKDGEHIDVYEGV